MKRTQTHRVRALTVATIALLAGCSSDFTVVSHAKVQAAPVPALYVAPPDRVLTSTLLDFDGKYDATFVDAKTVHLADDPERGGNRALAVDDAVRLNLGSLVRGRDFGGAWDMVGLRVRAESSMSLDIALRCGPSVANAPTRITLAPNVWTNVWLEIAPSLHNGLPTGAATSTTADDDAVCLSIAKSDSTTRAARFLVDDVALAQSHTTVSESIVPKTGERWSVARIGLRWQVSLDGKAIFELPAAPFISGAYHVAEAVPSRTFFQNDAGSTVSIDRTGRLIEDGRARLEPRVLKNAKAIAENASPACIEIIDGEGRVERSLPGDRDNDGYDELRGCYTVHAIAGRAAVRFTRQGATVKWPVLEVLDLPPGPVRVWLEGEIVSWPVRADDGRVIVELPVELQRPIEVRIRSK